MLYYFLKDFLVVKNLCEVKLECTVHLYFQTQLVSNSGIGIKVKLNIWNERESESCWSVTLASSKHITCKEWICSLGFMSLINEYYIYAENGLTNPKVIF